MIPIYLCIYYTLLLTSFYRQSLPWTPGSIALDLQSSYLRQYQASSHVVKDKIRLSFLPFESSLQTPSPAPAALAELICYSDAVKKKDWSSCWSQFEMYFWANLIKTTIMAFWKLKTLLGCTQQTAAPSRNKFCVKSDGCYRSLGFQ